MRTTVAISGAFVVAAGLTHFTHRALEQLDVEHSLNLRETLPSREALRLLALTYDVVVADYYWLKTVNEFGNLERHKAQYPNLIPLTERVLALDPWFRTAYRFAGTALTVNDLDPRASVKLLEAGKLERPDLWEVPFYLGFNYYYFLGEFDHAATNMALAARTPGAPPIAGYLATRLAAQAKRPEVGIEMIDSILETLDDEETRQTYMNRRNVLLLELHLIWLNDAVANYRSQTGACPESLADLVAAGTLHGVPVEPLGGEYHVADCRAATTSTYEKLRIHGKTGTWRDP